MAARCAKPEKHCHLTDLGRSTLAEHAVEMGHQIFFLKQHRFFLIILFPRPYTETIEIFKYPQNINRKEEALYVSDIWLLVFFKKWLQCCASNIVFSVASCCLYLPVSLKEVKLNL